MNALVTGGNGFIGSHLVDKLLQLGWQVTVLHKHETRRYEPMPSSVQFVRGDLTQTSLIQEAVQDIDVVFHLTWTTTAIHEVANRDPSADVWANVVPSINLIEACCKADVKRIVFTSSGGTVYGPATQVPIAETHPTNPINAYGISKLTVEKYLRLFEYLHNLDYVILRPSVPYGPMQNPLGKQGAVAVFLYRVAMGLPITIWGDGRVSRDYFYISDLVDALIASAVQSLKRERIFNIGGAEELSLNQLLLAVEQMVGKTAVVSYKPARSFDAPRILLDTTLAQQKLNWQPQVDFATGLHKTWQWMSEVI